MTYDDASLISNNILERAFRDKISVSPMKLQKIMYFVASEYAKNTGEPLFQEPFEAWKYGPVLRSIYREFKPFGGYSITKFATQDALGNTYRANEALDPQLRVAIDTVWTTARDRTAVELYQLTHVPGSAWSQAWASGQRQIGSSLVAEDTTYQENLCIPVHTRDAAK